MKVSQKTEYALRAMLELALHDDGEVTRLSGIAKSQQIPKKFLELILVELRRAGLVVSLRGPVGGHRLAKPPHEITVGDVWRAIEGPLDENGHRNGAPRRSGAEAGARADPFRGVWSAVDKSIAAVVDGVTLADIQEKAAARQSVADFNI